MNPSKIGYRGKVKRNRTNERGKRTKYVLISSAWKEGWLVSNASPTNYSKTKILQQGFESLGTTQKGIHIKVWNLTRKNIRINITDINTITATWTSIQRYFQFT